MEVAVESGEYDPGTKIWTTVLGVLVAVVIDWYAVVNPVRGHFRTSPSSGWWLVGLALSLIAPAGWLTGKLHVKDWNGVVIWTVTSATVIVANVVVMIWAGARV